MPSSLPALLLSPATVDALSALVPGLVKKRAFVPGASGVELRARCHLVLAHPENGARLALPAEVVFVQADGPAAGVGVELENVDADTLEAFVAGILIPEPEADEGADGVAEGADDATASRAPSGHAGPAGDPEDADTGAGAASAAPPAADGATEDADEATDTAEGDARAQARSRNLYERVRAMSLREREVCARSGSLPERVALERTYGNSVWEGLLQNPQLTPPEVARIAKNGTVSQPMLAQICGNAAWVSVGEVQRALLSNPRVNGPQLDRVLRSLSQSDLRRIGQQTAYRSAVRQAAQKLIKG